MIQFITFYHWFLRYSFQSQNPQLHGPFGHLFTSRWQRKKPPNPQGSNEFLWAVPFGKCHFTEDKVLLFHSLCFCMCFRDNSNIKRLLLQEQFISLNKFFHKPRLFIHFRTKKQYSIDAESLFVMQMTVLSLSVLKSQLKKCHRSMFKPQEMIDFLITTAMQLYSYLRLLLLDTFLKRKQLTAGWNTQLNSHYIPFHQICKSLRSSLNRQCRDLIWKFCY